MKNKKAGSLTAEQVSGDSGTSRLPKQRTITVKAPKYYTWDKRVFRAVQVGKTWDAAPIYQIFEGGVLLGEIERYETGHQIMYAHSNIRRGYSKYNLWRPRDSNDYGRSSLWEAACDMSDARKQEAAQVPQPSGNCSTSASEEGENRV